MSRRAPLCGGLPAAVVNDQVGDQGAAPRVQQAEIGQAVDPHAAQQASAGVVVVEADQRGDEHLLAVAHGTDGGLDQRDIGAQFPFVAGCGGAGTFAVAEVNRAGQQDGLLPGLEEELRREGVTLLGVDQFRKYGIRECWSHGSDLQSVSAWAGRWMGWERLWECGQAVGPTR